MRLATVLTFNTFLEGVAPEVNLKNTVKTRKHASKGIHPDFENQDRYNQKSTTGVSVAPQ